MIIVQQITTHWTKLTRGAAGREIRARLPDGYPLTDAILVSRIPMIEHAILRYESEDFAPRDTLPGSRRSVTTASEGTALRVTFRWPGDCGAPERSSATFLLEARSWGRVRYNGRFMSFEGGWYEDTIVNVAFALEPTRMLFIGAPSLTMDRRVDLW